MPSPPSSESRSPSVFKLLDVAALKVSLPEPPVKPEPLSMPVVSVKVLEVEVLVEPVAPASMMAIDPSPETASRVASESTAVFDVMLWPPIESVAELVPDLETVAVRLPSTNERIAVAPLVLASLIETLKAEFVGSVMVRVFRRYEKLYSEARPSNANVSPLDPTEPASVNLPTLESMMYVSDEAALTNAFFDVVLIKVAIASPWRVF